MLFPPQPRAKYCKNEGAGGGLPKEEEVDPASVHQCGGGGTGRRLQISGHNNLLLSEMAK
jgi:hypothetical protein